MKNNPTGNRNKIAIIAAIVVVILCIFFPEVREIVFETTEPAKAVVQVQDQEREESISTAENSYPEVTVEGFRNRELLEDHYEKHGKEMGFSSAREYEQAAKDVVANPSVLHKVEAEDGDDVYYVESTNEFVIVSTDGYIRTYFNPSDGLEYFERQ